MSKKGETKYAKLYADPDLQRWFDNLAHASISTAELYRGHLARFLAWAESRRVKDFLALPQRERDDVVADYVTYEAKRGVSGGCIKSQKLAVASWLDWHGLKIQRRIKVPGVEERVNTPDYQIPSQDGARAVLNAADARSRNATGFVAFAGVRPEVLGMKKGDKGLCFKDLPEAKLTAAGIEFTRTPTLIRVPAALNKVRKPYFTFLGPEGCEYLAASVKERIQAGETLTPDSAVVAPKEGRRRFLTTGSISSLIRAPLQKAGRREPPYIWRSYFRNRCMMAQSKGLQVEWTEFFMGHKGSLTAVYALHKTVPDDTLEAMRRAYDAALEFLETRHTGSRKDPVVDFVRLLLQAKGMTEKDVEAIDIASKSTQEIVELLNEAEQAAKAQQRLVPLDEVGTLVGQGWTVKCQLSDGRVVLEA